MKLKRFLDAVMWLCLVLAGLAASGHAQAAPTNACPLTINDAIAATDPAQTGRITRNGVASACGAAKVYPGTFATTGAFNYDVYPFTNRTGAPACVTFTLTQPGTTFGIHLVGYSTFDPANLAANYLGDSGASSVNNAAVSMGLTVAAGATVQVVVHTATIGSFGAYTLTAAGCGAGVAPTLGIGSLSNPSVFGQAVTVTASVTGGAAPGTGIVSFFDGATPLGTGTLDASGATTLTTSSLTLGTHPITFTYDGDGTYIAGTSAVLNQVVNKAPTATALASSQNPQVLGQAVTFTATVTVPAPGAGTPGGTVTFTEGGTVLGTGAVNGSGQATFTTSSLTVGPHPVVATYGGDATFLGSASAPLTQTMSPAASTVAVTSSLNPSTYGANVQFGVTVSSSAGGTPTGTVQFLDGATVLATVTLAGGTATTSTAALTAGTHTIAAQYSGDSNHQAANGSVSQVVNQAASATAVASSVNPSVFGQSTTFSATVTSAGGTPTGTVTFTEGATTLGAVAVNGSGVAALPLATLAVGGHDILATYGGDANFAGSVATTISQTVNKAGTATTVVSSSNPAGIGANLTFTATVAATAPGAGTPSGNVTFNDGATVLGTTALSGGTAAISTTALTAGAHSITVVYAGDGSFTTSTSAALAQTITTAGVTATLTSSPNPSDFGASVTFQATVAASAGGSATGTVTFKEGATTLGTGTLSAAGVASFSTSTLAAGTHAVIAEYGGDATHAGGSTAAVNQVVKAAATSTTLASAPNPSSVGESVTLTATVAAGSQQPTGNVTFKDGQTTLGTGTLSSGVATFSTSTLTAGVHALSASYDGTTNYAASASGVVSQTVGAGTGGDAGTGGGTDASTGGGGGGGGTGDAGGADAGTAGGSSSDSGCGCRTTSTSSSAGGALLGLIVLGLFAGRRRRR